ncbi:MAG: hypothetical protein ACQETV_04740 [Actinomycetota bacterium]
MAVKEFTFTQFLRESSAMLGHLKDTDLLLRRRDGEDLRVSLASRDRSQRDALHMLSHVLARVAEASDVDDRTDIVAEAMVREFPWVDFLPDDEASTFVGEFTRCARACAELDNVDPLVRLVREWKSTAKAWSDPELAEALLADEPGDGGVVPDPETPDADRSDW